MQLADFLEHQGMPVSRGGSDTSTWPHRDDLIAKALGVEPGQLFLEWELYGTPRKAREWLRKRPTSGTPSSWNEGGSRRTDDMYVQSLAHGAVQIDASAIHGGLGVVFDRKRRRWVLRAFSDGLRRDDYAVFDLAEGHSRDELVR